MIFKEAEKGLTLNQTATGNHHPWKGEIVVIVDWNKKIYSWAYTHCNWKLEI